MKIETELKNLKAWSLRCGDRVEKRIIDRYMLH